MKRFSVFLFLKRHFFKMCFIKSYIKLQIHLCVVKVTKNSHLLNCLTINYVYFIRGYYKIEIVF